MKKVRKREIKRDKTKKTEYTKAYTENVILAKWKIKTYDRYYQLALKTSEC